MTTLPPDSEQPKPEQSNPEHPNEQVQPPQPTQQPVQPPQSVQPPAPSAPPAPPAPAPPTQSGAPAHWAQPIQPPLAAQPGQPGQAQQAPQVPQAPQPPAAPQYAPPAYGAGQQNQQYSQEYLQQAYQPPQSPQNQQHGYQNPQQPQYQQAPPAYSYGAPQGQPGYAALPAPGPGEPFDGAAHPDDLTRPLYGANIVQAVTRFFKNYASFSGRASRSEYWWLALAMGGAWLVMNIFFAILSGATYTVSGGAAAAVQGIVGIITVVFWLGVIVPSLALTWRRLHDANLPGPFFFLTFIPFVGSIVLLVLTVLPPKPEGRRFTRN